jgi:hypothetical protein
MESIEPPWRYGARRVFVSDEAWADRISTDFFAKVRAERVLRPVPILPGYEGLRELLRDHHQTARLDYIPEFGD